MLLLILKDAVLLFLLLFAILHLFEHFHQFLNRILIHKGTVPKIYHILDITDVPADTLEYNIRQFIKEHPESVFLIQNAKNPESELILKQLKREFPALYTVSRSDLPGMISSPAEPDVSSETEPEEDPVQGKSPVPPVPPSQH